MIDSLRTATSLNILSTGNKKMKSHWNDDICECVKESQDINELSKEAGRPNQLHPLFICRKLASRNVRWAQRPATSQVRYLKFQL